MKKLTYLLILSIFLPIGLFAQNWEMNIDTALSKAMKEDKHVVLVFSGLDWCVPCVKMDRNMWQSEIFKKYANSNFVLLKADFPKNRRGSQETAQIEHNEQLKIKYNPKGLFPLIVLLDKNGEAIGHTLYKNIPAQEYIDMLNEIIATAKK